MPGEIAGSVRVFLQLDRAIPAIMWNHHIALHTPITLLQTKATVAGHDPTVPTSHLEAKARRKHPPTARPYCHHPIMVDIHHHMVLDIICWEDKIVRTEHRLGAPRQLLHHQASGGDLRQIDNHLYQAYHKAMMSTIHLRYRIPQSLGLKWATTMQ